MKIDGYQASRMYEAYAAKSGATGAVGQKETQVAGTEKLDRVEISSTASEMHDAVSLSHKIQGAESPDQRQNRIEKIKSMIADGTYQVPSESVAASILVGSQIDRKA